MSDALAIVLANALLTGAGFGVLWMLGIVATTRVRDALPAIGLALLTGVAAVMLIQIFLLVLGVGMRFRTSAALCFGIAIAGFLWRRRNPEPAQAVTPLRRDRMPRVEAALWLGALVVVAMFTIVAVRYYTVSPAEAFDEWAIWSKKALALYYFGELETEFFAAQPYAPMHQEYPILLPLLESFIFRAIDAPDTRAIHVEFLVLLAAFIGAAAYLCRRRAPGFVLWPILLLVAVTPFVHSQLATGYADVPVSFFVALGVLLLGLWLEDGHAPQLALATLLLGAGGNTKFEGVVVGAIAYLAIIAVLAQGRAWRRARNAALALGAFVALVLPWRIWVLAHPEIEFSFSVSRGLDPGYLLDHTELPREMLDLIGMNIADGSLLFLVPMALAVVLVCLVTGVARRLAAFYLTVSVAAIAAFVWVYWVDPTRWRAAHRVIDPMILIAVVAVIHIATVVFARRAEPSGLDLQAVPASQSGTVPEQRHE